MIMGGRVILVCISPKVWSCFHVRVLNSSGSKKNVWKGFTCYWFRILLFSNTSLKSAFLNHQQKKWQKVKAQHFDQLSRLWGTCWDASQNIPTSEGLRKPPLMHMEISLEKFPGSQFLYSFLVVPKKKSISYRVLRWFQVQDFLKND